MYDPEDNTLDMLSQAAANVPACCILCKHLHADHFSCDAFPEVIPQPILSGQVAHTRKFHIQKNNVIFERKDDK